MNFYKLIKQQYDDYRIEETTIHNRCKRCPCKTLRDKMFKRTLDCSLELNLLMDKCDMHDNINIFFCDDCRRISVEIAKKLFGKKEFNKI